jgi:hypothetical protein
MSNQWIQIGQDINGEADDDQSGLSVSINNSGNIIAIGARYNDDSDDNSGHVRIYKFNKNINLFVNDISDGSWIKIGQDINGESSGDQSGFSVSINNSGNIIAICAPLNDGSGNNNIGHVRIYKFNKNIELSANDISDGSWIQIGQDIDGELNDDNSGFSVSINNNGNIIAIGAPNNDGNGGGSGHVRIYKFNKNIELSANDISNGLWIQIGQDINGEAVNDRSGFIVSINNNGNVIAIGAPNNDGSGIDSGHVRIYKFNRNIELSANDISDGSWIQIGQDINGDFDYDQNGYSVSINDSGNIIGIGAPYNNDNGNDSGHVRIYKFNKNIELSANDISNGLWIQIGQDINGEAENDQSGWSVSINNSGNIVAIGAINNDGNGSNSGHVRIYKFNKNIELSANDISDGSWIQIGQDIDGEASGDKSGHSVSINNSGNIIAIGAPNNESGYVKIYKFNDISDNTPPCLTEDTEVLTINGYKNIKQLQINDLLITNNNNFTPIINIFKTQSLIKPYIIEKSSIAKNYPPRRTTLSSGHLIKYKTHWIHPQLSNKFKKQNIDKPITYYHIETANYDKDCLIINGGLIVETYTGCNKKFKKIRKQRIKKYITMNKILLK